MVIRTTEFRNRLTVFAVLIALGAICGAFIGFVREPIVQGEAAVSLHSDLKEPTTFDARLFFDGLDITLRRQMDLHRLQNRHAFLFAVERPASDSYSLLLRARGRSEVEVGAVFDELENIVKEKLPLQSYSDGIVVEVAPRWPVTFARLQRSVSFHATYGAMLGLLAALVYTCCYIQFRRS